MKQAGGWKTLGAVGAEIIGYPTAFAFLARFLTEGRKDSPLWIVLAGFFGLAVSVAMLLRRVRTKE